MSETSMSPEEHAERFDLRHADFAPFGEKLFEVYDVMRERAPFVYGTRLMQSADAIAGETS
jgi:hypothetical protein